MAEQINELLMKNHQSHSTGSTSFPKEDGTSFYNHKDVAEDVDVVGRAIKIKETVLKITQKKNSLYHQKWNNIETKNDENKGLQSKHVKI